MCLKTKIMKSTEAYWDNIEKLKNKLNEVEAVIIGAGAGLSTSAGFTYSGERFRKYFSDFADKYGFQDMYSDGFYSYSTLEEYWAYWSRYIYVNRYMDAPKPVYNQLYEIIKNKDYFVLTTNVDHCFQKAGFSKKRLFYTQGDYGLFQCSEPYHDTTYDNEEVIRNMVKSQGYVMEENGLLKLSKQAVPKMVIPSEQIPYCPKCGKPMSMNLRADNTFVEDEGWHRASERYALFLRRHQNMKILFLELGTGMNTPGIIKYPFWQMTYQNPKAVYACVNLGEAYAPKEIGSRAICINGDIGEVLELL